MFRPSLLLLFLDPGSGIRDPGSGIRDKHPGSATLHLGVSVEEHEEHVISILASLFKIFMIVTHLGVSVEEHEEHVISILASLSSRYS